MKHPTVTAVMAAYNCARTIDESISSVLLQRSCEVDLIVCDDNSTDATRKIVSAHRNPRLNVIENKSNIGPGPSRDRAIEASRGDWVALIDADDTWHRDRISTLLRATEILEADVVFDDTLLCHDTNDGIRPWKPLHGTNGFSGYGRSPRIVPIESYITSHRLLIHPIIRNDFICKTGIRHSDRRFGEDAEFYLKLAMAGARFCYVPQPLYQYRITPDSLTAQASDPSLMRQCIEECSHWEGWWPSAHAAFANKIETLRRNEAMYALSDLLTKRRALDALRLLRSEPHLLGALPRKLLVQLRYQTHRLSRGGRRR